MQIIQTEAYSTWFAKVGDIQAKARIVARIRRMELGKPGDAKSVGDSASEMRIDHGPGYRVYFTKRGKTVVILLCGGDKKSQKREIETAKRMAKEV
ncbi:type II toxin-antitoxin system RelE/ParE family toxin [Bradyrhizobium sp. Leo121]|uniref:type II toxin-antitoxin system RelE/ParE family toxin n=1 Tax=Bradyrhizobium sp. Leo121 TaxID=1571195 RepID=UPI00102A2F1D|nr:type II toxin-antitoxin system RelE/ParE family toxin [Bradyrhizobium sp. Leo121]RZN21090.1 addiction module antitoxin RelB [Bradyrhizobium sp. Leo121]